MTTADGSKKLAPFEAIPIQLGAGQIADVVVDTGRRYQPFFGYGASITDASAWLLEHELDDVARAQLLQELFGEGGELGLDLTRITIGASDFSRSHYTYADIPGEADADIAPARSELIPALLQIRAINPRLKVIASPWSAPAWMKTSRSLITGRLDPAHYQDYAHYLISYAKEMGAAGVPIDMLTIQNEPHFEPADYPGMRVDPAERASFVGEFLGPMMDRDIPHTRLLDWDHNWDEPDSPLAVLADTRAFPFVDGVAWHCYGGDVSAQSVVHERYPDKETWFTECAAGDWSGDWTAAFQSSARSLVIGAPRNWARGVVMWNLALDQNHGPHMGGCGNCRGLITIDTESGAITREPEYYAFAHGSRFLPRDSVRIGAATNIKNVDAVAFHGEREETVALIIFNGSDGDENISITIDRMAFQASMPQGSLATYLIKL
ncbi:glycoside hydrolase family 30 protein [Allopontixanthobacter sp.]|uniref:glycoside hydrolase family 30 protein n=1 Tax=Allopontixanthobacter sp. TaxID=2906452 RepID=UPI002ABC1985|nr:glycoside hydrolase family 30 beta sandwich domain-containing protein [Allopontixanthobacter sp.]MDZ4307835.1 glycoside hydrolase family 30 beta sandwich domain-containing protein [Allopontixanthobacter sp.]